MRVQDVDLSGADDPTVLDWAAQQGRVVLTHDVATMISFAYERTQAELSMPGLFEVSRQIKSQVASHKSQVRHPMLKSTLLEWRTFLDTSAKHIILNFCSLSP